MSLEGINVNPGSQVDAVPVAVDKIAGVNWPVYKPAYGAAGSVTLVDASNPLPVSARDYFFEVANGRIPGFTGNNVISHSSGITTPAGGIKTVWEEPLLYTYSTTADIDVITSTSASDTHVLTIIGLDVNYNEVIQTVTLTGQTPKALDTPLMRVNLIFNDSSTPTAGGIYVWVSGGGSVAGVPTVPAAIRSRIIFVSGISNERSVTSVYTVPAGKRASLVFGKASASDNQAIELTFWVRQVGKVFILAHHVDFKNNNYDYFFKLPGLLSEKSDIEVRATTGAGTSEVSASYDLIFENIV